ncbi:unnamed protein product [Medioppia subpectinata]|uniref:ABC transporter domain-containing protein n=1 Tax=Medioppia subpectinata TaxID=1979941 RepID=A0A7R9PUJ8_9ACAR|nr:unnamed protein product [Medioppia subpectinata]CAG2101653.1 unnamed protein product [Medioppia subpectinata]
MVAIDKKVSETKHNNFGQKDSKRDNEVNGESKMYLKDSLDRFGDDLVRLILSYHSIDDRNNTIQKRCLHECVSKQFQRLIFDTINELNIANKVILRLSEQNNDLSDEEFCHKLIIFLQKKCPKIQIFNYNLYIDKNTIELPYFRQLFEAIDHLRNSWPFLKTLMLPRLTQWGVRQSAEMESQMTSVERIIEYSKLPQEAALTAHDSHKPPPDWPQKGEIEFKDMSLCYEGSDKPVLKNLNCVIKSGEKIGIVGRTGAGKSSIISALFRMVEPKGEIVMDGLSVRSIGLHELRSKISIIPQDPVLFAGSVRRNLDPFGEYSDQRIWSALEEVQLKEAVGDLPGQLDGQLAEGGANLSVGQKQLVCLARAILRHNKVLVLDEATANVDHQTDALIQTTIRRKFNDCTVLTIAHRLNTIIDCDRVLVLDAGEIIEFDKPFVLLQRKGQLYDMCRKTGKHMFKHLLNMAKKSHLK